MPHSNSRRVSRKGLRPKYVPMLPAKPMTEDELRDQEAIQLAFVEAMNELSKKPNHGLKDSMWASPQLERARLAKPCAGAAKIMIPCSPKSPPLNAMARVFVSGDSLASSTSSSNSGVGLGASIWAVQTPRGDGQILSALSGAASTFTPSRPKNNNKTYPTSQKSTQNTPTTPASNHLPPHLRLITPAVPLHPQAAQDKFAAMTPKVAGAPSDLPRSGYILPHLRRSVSPQARVASKKSPARTILVGQPVSPRSDYVLPSLQQFVIPQAEAQAAREESAATIAVPPFSVTPQSDYVLPHLRSSGKVAPAQARSFTENFVDTSPKTPNMAAIQSSYVLPHLRGTRPAVLTQPAVSSENSEMVATQSSYVLPHLRSTRPAAPAQPATTSQIPPHSLKPVTPGKSADSSRDNSDRESFLHWHRNKQASEAAKIAVRTIPPYQILHPSEIYKKSVDNLPSTGSSKALSSPSQDPEAVLAAAFRKQMTTAAPLKNYGAPAVLKPEPLHNISERVLANAYDNKKFQIHDASNQNFQEYMNATSCVPSGRKYAQVQLACNGARSQAETNQSMSQSRVRVQKKLVESIENKKPVARLSQVSPQNVCTSNNMAQKSSRALADITNTGVWSGISSINDSAGKISLDIKLQPDIAAEGTPLTRDALIRETGFKTAKECSSSENQISNAGIDASAQHSQDFRATRGNDPAPLVDWDGRWAAGPCDWESERGTFDNSFVPDFIRDWQRELPRGTTIDISAPGFVDGTCPVGINEMIAPLEHKNCFPDTKGASCNLKREWQTAEVEAHNALVRHEQRQKMERKKIELANKHYTKIAAFPVEANPFSPQIDVYLRPVENKDARDISIIYNHYILNTNIPEDQEKVTMEDMLGLIKITESEHLPFIVAVKGRLPAPNDAQGRPGPSKKSIMPAVESIIGFSFSERYNYGFSGLAKGRSRASASLQLYVHPGYTRKGVGRSLLDRLIHCITPAYAYKNACDWINPTNDKVNEAGGGGLFHQVFFHVPVEQRHDANIGPLSRFLMKFHIREHENRLKGACRSSTRGNQAHFLDIAIFQYETSHEGNFDGYQ
ncbi:unnamed protein product [Diplocarpon coronariae]